jgi:hypothetical protein
MLPWISIDVVAIYAAVVATGAFFLELRRWGESGVKLRVTVMPFAQLVGSFSEAEKNRAYIVLNVANIGDRPTTITHFVVQQYPSRLHKYLGKPSRSALVNQVAGILGASPIPYVLTPGSTWTGFAIRDEGADLIIESAMKPTFAGVFASHCSKFYSARI